MTSKFLKVVSYDVLSHEPILSQIENPDLTVLSLLDIAEKNQLNITHIHKLIFLLFAEKKCLVPFSFIKHQFGPFSTDIEKKLPELERRRVIQKNKQTKGKYDSDVYTLLESGKQVLHENKDRVKEYENLLKQVYLKYKDDHAVGLERRCYEVYYLRSKNTSVQDWALRIKGTMESFRARSEELLQQFDSAEEIEENEKMMICTSFSYVGVLLTRLNQMITTVDQVTLGVLLNSIDEYLSTWEEIKVLLFTPTPNEYSQEKFLALIHNANILFKFINVVAEGEGVLESVFGMKEITG